MPEPKPIAIVGVGVLMPGSSGAEGFWRDIVAGRDLITDVPARRWLIEDHYDPNPQTPDKTYCKRGAFLSPVDFDPLEFGVPPSAIPATDTCQLLSLLVARWVIDDFSRGQSVPFDRERAGVILGVTSGQELFLEVSARLRRPVWIKALRESGISEDRVEAICEKLAASSVPWQENTFPGMLGNVVAGRIANRFDFHGTNCVTDAACASSLAAVSMAVDELRLGRADLMITGGADTFNDISMYVAFSKTPALSSTGDCRPFSDRADGTVLGEGFAMFALKRLEDAERDGNPIYAVIRGIGTSSDGRSKSIYAPLPTGQARAMHRAYEEAGFGPDTVGLVEAHGTGTAAGDLAELTSLNSVFSPAAHDRRPWCALGSVKSQVGHTKAASGAAGLFKAAMALHHKTLPPTIKVERPNPALELDNSPFYLNLRSGPWIHSANHPRRAGVSSFGFGGTNFHVVLEEYHGPASKPPLYWTAESELILLCAGTASSLGRLCEQAALRCETGRASLASIGYSSQISFSAEQAQRIAIVGSSKSEIAAKLRRAAAMIASGAPAEPGVFYSRDLPAAGPIAFLFPGQGSQYPWMGADLAAAFPAAREVWERAAWLAETVFPRPSFEKNEAETQASRLAQTEVAQPALGAATAALLAVLRDAGLQPTAVAGHSFGELSALFAAHSIDEPTLFAAARHRGELMAASAGQPAGMLSLAAGVDEVSGLLAGWGLNLVIANRNAPRQTVLSGESQALREAERRLAEHNVRTVRLPVSTAFHSPLMRPAAEAFASYLDGQPFQQPAIPVYSNLDGRCLTVPPPALAARLAEQIAAPVCFQQMIEQMYEDGIRTFVEVGPRDVLTNMVRNILEGRDHRAIALDRQRANGVFTLFQALGQLSALGVPVNYRDLRREHVIPLEEPQAPPRFTIPVDGGNVGRPYPPAEGVAAIPAPIPPPIPPPAPKAEPKTELATAPAPIERNPSTEVPNPSSDRLRAYEVFQQSINTAQQHFQDALAKSHESFLASMEAAFASAVGAPAPQAAASLPVPAPAPPAHPPLPAPRHVEPPPPALPNLELSAILIAIVADKTGYPAEMLNPSMALEADLGIDSIKRVEIFSALQEQLPHLPEIDPALMGTVTTLGEITALLAQVSPTPAKAPAVPAPAPTNDAIASILLRIVADKTGYPAEMLNSSMALEADLGIDSIKRVEIFSAVQEQLPHLPEIDPAMMGTVTTLGEITALLAQVSPAPAMAPAIAAPAPTNDAIASILLRIVAGKTGYPAEMLNPSMALEADLGIDSIKRVEIFSAVQEQLPHLPEIDPAMMGTVTTLGEITALLAQVSPAPAKAAAAAPTNDAIASLLLQIVAGKTGYPAEMLNPSMALEADLGIDSIKRVEIFSALQEQLPHLPEIDPAMMGALQTLGDIVSALSGLAGAPSSPEPTPPNSGLEAALLAIIADKTGYPTDVLQPTMALEADLGIDSIKRVEIFSALADQFPHLPEFDSARLGSIVTIADVVAAVNSPAPPPAVAEAPQSPSPDRLISAPRPAPAAGHATLLPEEGSVVITPGPDGLGAALARILSAKGFTVTSNPADPSAAAWIHLGTLLEAPTVPEAISRNREAFQLAKTAAKRLSNASGAFVTVQDTGGNFLSPQALSAWSSGAAALARTAAIEWPKARVKAIDLDRAGRDTTELAQILAAELLAGGPEIDTGLPASGARITLDATASAVDWSEAHRALQTLPAKPVLLVTGGARGVTAASLLALANALSSRGGLRIAILGRTPLSDEPAHLTACADEPSLKRTLLASNGGTPAQIQAQVSRILAAREVRRTLAALSAAGSEVRYMPVDIRDTAPLHSALASLRAAWGPLDGLIHGAGVLADKRIADLTTDQFDSVFSTKVEALHALLEATAADPLRFLILFSSVASRHGNAGQAAYAMANEVLNKAACAEASRRGPGVIVKSICWGPWDGGMVTPALSRHFERMGVPLLSLEGGARAFVEEFVTPGSVEVVRGAALPAPAQELHVRISRSTHPHLDDHRIKDVPVLPVVEALHLFLQKAVSEGDAAPHGTRIEIKVLNGVRLQRFDDGGDSLVVRRQGDRFELVSDNGTRHYEARIAREPRNGQPSTRKLNAPLETPPWNALYDAGLLFHGPSFQVVQQVDGISKQGISGKLLARNGQQWRHGVAGYDGGMIDGGLQFAQLWGFYALRRMTLPMRIGAIRLLRPPAEHSTITCEVVAVERNHSLVCDIAFTCAEHGLIATMSDVEMYAVPGA